MKPPHAYDTLRLERARLQYEQGHKRQLLYSLDFCLTNNVEVPPWVKKGLSNAMDAAHYYRIKSWDDVFGVVLPKSKRLATEQRNMKISWDLFNRVRDLHEAGAAIDEDLFEKVGKEFGVGKTLASELYYTAGRDLTAEFEEDAALAQELAKRKALDRGTSEEN
jgi:hypothetical protein